MVTVHEPELRIRLLPAEDDEPGDAEALEEFGTLFLDVIVIHTCWGERIVL